MKKARVLDPAKRTYRGALTDPARWASWTPREGDILVCTPPKCGTTWTQTILAMLLHGGADLPQKLPVMSPWVDADLGVPAEDVAAVLQAQDGRRVVKTHTPADGFPVWDGVSVIAVYRHPLDVFFSLRKHNANMSNTEGNPSLLLPVSEAFRDYMRMDCEADDFDRDCLATLTHHYQETVLSGRVGKTNRFHYAQMTTGGKSTVERLAAAASIEADSRLVESVTEATGFAAMKSRAADYAPVGGTGFWKSDAGFFDSATSRKWEGQLSEAELALYKTRLAELVPDQQARSWLENGEKH